MPKVSTPPHSYTQSPLPSGYKNAKIQEPIKAGFMGIDEKSTKAGTTMNTVMSSSAMGNFMVNDIKEQIEFSTKLFLTQLQNQIPGNETDTDEMVRTLMGMMQAVQQVKTNMLMEDSNDLERQLHSLEMARLQGRVAEYEGNVFSFEGSPQEFFTTLPGGVSEATIVITDGESIIQTLACDPSFGRKKIIWDGTNKNGETVTPGIYNAELWAVDELGNRSTSKLSMTSPITSILFDKHDDRAYFMAGDVRIDSVERLHQKYKHMQNNIPASAIPQKADDIEL